jgi:hypothetical protein
VGFTGEEQDALGGSRFSSINMSNDADVSIPFERERARLDLPFKVQ